MHSVQPLKANSQYFAIVCLIETFCMRKLKQESPAVAREDALQSI